MQTYFVDLDENADGRAEARQMRYVAMAETPDAAVETVRVIVGPGADLTCRGQTLSSVIARAIGIRPGQARLV